MEAIRVESLGRSFGGAPALSGVSFVVHPGEAYGLVGPDGAGKTTLLRILSGILRADSGRAFIEGIPVAERPEEVKRRIGVMNQRFGLYADLTVAENLRFFADLQGTPRRLLASRGEALLAAAGLGPFHRRRAGDLSGGMKQKLALACALIAEPKVLLLDEPTNGVDPASRRDFWRILHRLTREGLAILVTTAYLEEAERCGRVGFLKGGRILAEGPPEQLRAELPGALFEFRTTDSRRIGAEIAARRPDLSVDVMGERVLVLADETEADGLRAMVSDLLGDAAATGIRRVPPTLENAFVFRLSGGEAGDEPA